MREAGRLLRSRRKALLRETGGDGPSPPANPSAQSELEEIDAALARIARGTYGTCEECGGAIGRDRLRALPEVRRCEGCTL